MDGQDSTWVVSVSYVPWMLPARATSHVDICDINPRFGNIILGIDVGSRSAINRPHTCYTGHARTVV